jgi:hypothetical protein
MHAPWDLQDEGLFGLGGEPRWLLEVFGEEGWKLETWSCCIL